MTTYLVFARPGVPVPDEASVVIADRFAWLAFLAPVIWLLVSRLWLEAAVIGLIQAAVAMTALDVDFVVPGLVLGFALSLLTGLEGRNWYAAALRRRGWRLVDLVESGDADTAFEIHVGRAAARLAASGTAAARLRPLWTGHQNDDNGAIGLVPVERT